MSVLLTTIWARIADLHLSFSLCSDELIHFTLKITSMKRRWMYEVFVSDTRKCLKVALNFIVNGIWKIVLIRILLSCLLR